LLVNPAMESRMDWIHQIAPKTPLTGPDAAPQRRPANELELMSVQVIATFDTAPGTRADEVPRGEFERVAVDESRPSDCGSSAREDRRPRLCRPRRLKPEA
jgi:hypothetical protein